MSDFVGPISDIFWDVIENKVPELLEHLQERRDEKTMEPEPTDFTEIV